MLHEVCSHFNDKMYRLCPDVSTGFCGLHNLRRYTTHHSKGSMSFILNGGAAIGHPYAPLQIQTAGRDVVVCGTVNTADNRNLEFQIADIRIVLSFSSDGGEPRFGSASAAGATLQLSLFNFNNPLDSGTTAPIEIGTLNGRKLLLSFTIYALTPESVKTVHYTFKVGDPV